MQVHSTIAHYDELCSALSCGSSQRRMLVHLRLSSVLAPGTQFSSLALVYIDVITRIRVPDFRPSTVRSVVLQYSLYQVVVVYFCPPVQLKIIESTASRTYYCSLELQLPHGW